MRVRDIMNKAPVVVGPETSLKDVARLLEERDISGVPVVEDGTVVGVVSQADIVSKEQEARDLDRPGRLARFRRRGHAPRSPRTAREAMSSPPVTVEPYVSAVGAAWLMTEDDVNRLPVVDRGRLVGIVTRTDLVRAFARSDEQIAREIVDEVLPSLDLSPNDVTVSVHHGEVRLRGAVDDPFTVPCLPHAVRSVVGVLDVRSEVGALHPPESAGHRTGHR